MYKDRLQWKMKKGKETKSNNKCKAPSQHQLESHQGDGLNQLQENIKHCFKTNH